MSFRREKYVPRGGPSGGDGGKGGDVVLRVNPKMSTLGVFHKRVHFKAKHGSSGGSANKTGASADTLYIDVPPGTTIRDAETKQLLGDLVQPYEQVIVARGGRGGRGNARFTSASNQAPRFAEKGEPGEERWLELELKLIADVGIVGLPNAGKSTLLSVISNARPKIADYPFTTLEPNLGVVLLDDRDLVFADIPGLIEGAHMGVGLGHSFLRHVQRTRLLVHLIDGSSADALADYSQIQTELALYDESLATRPQIVVVSKMDLPDAKAQWPDIQAQLRQRGIEPLSISAATQTNTDTLIRAVFDRINQVEQEQPHPTSEEVELPVYELGEQEMTFEVITLPHGFRVSGRQIERAASMTYWEYEEAVNRFQNILETLGITRALQEAGVQPGDSVFIGEFELEWTD